MHKIAICDDEISTCSHLENILLSYAHDKNINFDVDVFYTGESLHRFLESANEYDILFLDIELQTITGIEIGKFIRNVLKDEKSVLIYISSKEQYAMKLFQTRPLDFLIKPLVSATIERVLDYAISLVDSGKHFFEYKVEQSLFRVKYCDIIYFRSIKRKILIAMTTGTTEFYGHLNEIMKCLPTNQFIQIHKSYIIHYEYVAEYHYDWIKTVDDEIINISKPFRKKVRTAIIKRG